MEFGIEKYAIVTKQIGVAESSQVEILFGVDFWRQQQYIVIF